MKDHIKILGLIYKITEVECVSKEELRKGEINFLTNEIRIDKNMPDDLKEQVLIHEVLHAIFEVCTLLMAVREPIYLLKKKYGKRWGVRTGYLAG